MYLVRTRERNVDNKKLTGGTGHNKQKCLDQSHFPVRLEMRLPLPVGRFERHVALFHLLHIDVPLKGEGREVQQTAPNRQEMRMPHVTKRLELSVGAHLHGRY